MPLGFGLDLTPPASSGGPVLPTAGVLNYWVADDAPNSGGHVSGNWLDRIASAALAPQSSPAWAASQTNGHAAVTTDGAASYLVNSTVAKAQAVEVWLVMKQITWNNAGAGYILSSDGGNTVIAQSGTTPQIATYAGASEDCNNGNLAVGSWGIVRAVLNGASSEIQVDNGSPVTGTPGTNGLSGGINIGAQPGGGLFSNIATAAITIIDPTAGGYSATALYTYLSTVFL